MKKKLLALLCILLAFALVACAAGEKAITPSDSPQASAPQSPGALEPGGSAAPGEPVMSELAVVAMSAPPATFDIMTTPAASSNMVGFHIYEMLLAFNAESEITPALAAEWEASENDTVFTFKLKEGVTFHDGSAFTSQDVKASIERYNRVGYRKDTLFANVKSVDTPDDSTLVITMSEPTPLFLYDVALNGMGPFVVMPSEACSPELDYPNLADGKVIGTGPYMLEESVPGDHITLKRFKNYVPDVGIPASGFVGERHAWFERVKFAVVPEKASRLNGLIAGEYQYVEELDITTYERLASEEGVRPEIISPAWIPTTMLNTLEGPLSDPKVRQAILLALDNETILIAATGNNKDFYELDPGMFYSYQYWYSDAGSDKYNKHDVAAAKKLVEESGYNGETIYWATTKDYEWMYQISVVVQQQLKEIGLNVELQINDWPTMVDLLVNGSKQKDWDMFSTGMSLFDVVDPTGLNGMFLKETGSLPYISDEMDQYMKDGMSSSDPAVRKQVYDKAQELFYKDIPFLVYGKTNTLYGASSKLVGESPWFQTRMWNVWLQS